VNNRWKETTVAHHTELTENEKTWENLVVSYNTLQRARELELAKVGLTIAQAGVLYFVATSAEPLTPMKLSRVSNRQPHTISALLTRMEAQGLVKTTHDLKRKNWVRVSLTKKGQQAYKHQMTQRTVRNATSCLSDIERDQLNAICKKLRAKGAQLIRDMQPTPYSDLLF
jgi:DNA-binding MarR family transcriptional regulator